ncbi:MAG: TMEM175 family protein [Acidimicrobiales bacterium]
MPDDLRQDGAASDDPALRGQGLLGTHRLEAFSDGVMAVIITIMALDLRVPSSTTWHAVREQVPRILAFALSFSFIAIYWNNHHHLLRAARRISAGVMWANMLLLFWLALVPVLTAWIAHAPGDAMPAAFYGADALLASVAYGVLVRVIIRADGPGSAVAAGIGNDLKGNVSVVAYAVAVPLAVVSPWIAYALFVAVALVWMVPDRRLFGRA